MYSFNKLNDMNLLFFNIIIYCTEKKLKLIIKNLFIVNYIIYIKGHHSCRRKTFKDFVHCDDVNFF